ncbi:hypothetical protein [Vagococcus carniphilus]|uniref:hypothetical protein n=1 Tax=Vagococcus carniphilus TaxID=218144 RepID=UPI003B5C2B6E
MSKDVTKFDNYSISMLLTKKGVTSDLILDDLIGMNCKLKKKEKWVNEILNYSYKKFKIGKQYRESIYKQEKSFISVASALFLAIIVNGIIENVLKLSNSILLNFFVISIFSIILLLLFIVLLSIVTQRNDVLMIYKIIEYYLDDYFFECLDIEYINSFSKLDKKSVDARKKEIIDTMLNRH